MRNKRCCGHEGDTSSEECVPEIYTSKRTQKCDKAMTKRGVIAYKLTSWYRVSRCIRYAIERLILELVLRYGSCKLVKIPGLGCKALFRCDSLFQLR